MTYCDQDLVTYSDMWMARPKTLHRHRNFPLEISLDAKFCYRTILLLCWFTRHKSMYNYVLFCSDNEQQQQIFFWGKDYNMYCCQNQTSNLLILIYLVWWFCLKDEFNSTEGMILSVYQNLITTTRNTIIFYRNIVPLHGITGRHELTINNQSPGVFSRLD